MVVRGDGLAGWFASSGSNYVSPQGTVGQLSAATGGGYLLSYPSGEHYEFNATGLLMKYVDSRQRATTFTYDQEILSRVTDYLGHATNFTYANGQLSAVTDFAGRITRFDNPSGQVASIRLADPNVLGGTGGPETQFAYTADGSLATVTDPMNNVTRYTYDSMDHCKR